MKEGADAPPVIGIGASAGGLEAVKEMLQTVRADCGLAFVLVQHLDPNHESMMAELIGRVTALEVRQIQDGDRVSAGTLHVIPPGSALSIEQGELLLSDFEEPRGVRRPIDTFLASLAEDQGGLAAAVVLSGTGADGASGLRAVKEAGGVAAAQEPGTARYDGMPTAAVATGLVDFVLPPGQLAEALAGYFARRAEDDGSAQAAAVVAEHVDDLCETIRELIGHDFSGYKRSTVIRRIERRMQVLGIDSAPDYLERVRGDEDECMALFRDLLINVTRFFRDPEAFDALEDQAIRALVRSAKPSDAIRVWVPGCSSGQEAYSIAMLIDVVSREMGVRRLVQVFATDIDEEMLSIAREGRYPIEDIADIPERFREECVIGREGEFVMAPHIRDMVRFSSHSVIKDPPFGRLDLISCRNMLIYMGERIQASVIPLFHYALRPGRFLFLGPSETIGRHEELFEPVDRRFRLFKRTEHSMPRPIGLPISMSTERRTPTPALAARQAERSRARAGAEDTVAQRLLSTYAPPHVLVGPSGEVLRTGGKLSRYLEYPDGDPSTPLSRIARPGLREVIGPVLGQAREAGARVVREDIEVVSEFGRQPLLLVADPMPDGTVLVLFLADGRFREELSSEIGPVGTLDDPVVQLEEEMRILRLRLRTTVEELETANEELKSSNEEMMSMNEELQSANEELSTVNEELKNKLDELAMAHDDMRNFLDSTELAVVMVDSELRIRSVTPAARELIGIGERDVGNGIAAVSAGIVDAGLIDEVRGVLETGKPLSRHVDARYGDNRFRMRILPYRSEDGVLTGATIIFIDVTGMLDLEDRLREQSERLALALMVSRMGVWAVDLATGTADLDAAVAQFFGVGEEGCYEVDALFGRIHPEDRETVRDAYARAIEAGVNFEGIFRIGDETTPPDSMRWIKGIGRRVDQPEGRRIVGINYDITDEQRAFATNALLLQEMDHRVKNLFAVTAAMVGLAARTHTDVRSMARDVRARIEALARAHEVTKGRVGIDTVRLRSLVDMILEPYGTGDRISVEGPDVTVPSRMVTPLGLVLHEWATNASKYGAFSNGEGMVTVRWVEDAPDGSIRLEWNETGGPRVVTPIGRGGFGSRLVEISASQMNGTVETDLGPDGFNGRISIADEPGG